MRTQKGLTPLVFPVVIVCVIVLVGVGYLLGRTNRAVQNKPVMDTTISQNFNPAATPIIPPGSKCSEYKEFSNDELYTKYTVRPGDSILSVAKNQLGDPSKIDEIIQLNKDRYPYIENNAFLELGWVLYLPNKTATPDTYLLGGISGKIANITNAYFGVTNAQATATTDIYQSKNPQYATNFPFKVGDCVTVKYYAKDQIPYSIALQPITLSH